MKKYLNILSAIILGVSCLTFVAPARGQLDSTRDAATPKVISPEEAAKKYPLPAGKKRISAGRDASYKHRRILPQPIFEPGLQLHEENRLRRRRAGPGRICEEGFQDSVTTSPFRFADLVRSCRFAVATLFYLHS